MRVIILTKHTQTDDEIEQELNNIKEVILATLNEIVIFYNLEMLLQLIVYKFML